MSLTLANKITLLRIFTVPLFILLIVYYGISVRHGQPISILKYLAFFIFVGAVILDGVDGYIARTKNQITRLGTMLDPIADKALLLSGLILLSHQSTVDIYPYIPIWFVILVISRDSVLIFGAIMIHLLNGSVTVKPRMTGKITTVLQMSVIAWALILFKGPVFDWIIRIAALFTLASGIQYSIDGSRQLEKSPATEH